MAASYLPRTANHTPSTKTAGLRKYLFLDLRARGTQPNRRNLFRYTLDGMAKQC